MTQDLFGICPYVTAQRVLRGKWSIVILHHLEDGPVRFNELQRRLPEMTHATLAKQLRSLEEYGVITRTEYPQVPPKVEYALSPLGEPGGYAASSTWARTAGNHAATAHALPGTGGRIGYAPLTIRRDAAAAW